MPLRIKSWAALAVWGAGLVQACAGRNLNDVGDLYTSTAGAAAAAGKVNETAGSANQGGETNYAPGPGAGGNANQTPSAVAGDKGLTGDAGAAFQFGFDCAGCQLLGEVGKTPAIAANAQNVYWLEHGTRDGLDNYQNDGRLLSQSLANAHQAAVATEIEGPVQLGLSAHYAYVLLDEASTASGSELVRIPLGGGALESVQALAFVDEKGAPLNEYPDWFYSQFAAGDDYVAWVNGKTVYRIAETPGATPETVLQVDGLMALFGDASLIYLHYAVGLYTVPYTGGERTLIREFSDAVPDTYSQLSVSGGYIYGKDEWFDQMHAPKHYIVRMVKTGSSWERTYGFAEASFRTQMVGSEFVTNSPQFRKGRPAVLQLLHGEANGQGWLKAAAVGSVGDTGGVWRAWAASSAGIFLEYEGKLYRAPLGP